MFYLVNKTEDLSLRHSLSDSSEELLGRGKGGASTCQRFCNKDQVIEASEDDC